MTSSKCTTTDVTDADSLTLDIANAVGEATDVDPLELPPLYDYVDVDALGEYFRTTSCQRGREEVVAFRFSGQVVEVRGDGAICVSPLSETEQSMAGPFQRSAVDPGGNSRGGGGTRDMAPEGYQTTQFETEDGGLTVIQDPDNDRAWIESNFTVESRS